MDSDWLKALVKKFEHDNKISTILGIETKSALAKGENYLSLISRGTINVVLGSGIQSKRQVIIKEALGEKAQAVMKDFNVFKSETKMYQNILKRMEEVMYEFGDTTDTLWCNMLGYKPYSTIVLEDLTMDGYKVVPRRDSLDLEHILLVVRSLAKFHCLSKILLENGIIAQDDVGDYWFEKDIGKTTIEGSLRQLSNAIINSWPLKWKEIGLKIQAGIPEAVQKLTSFGKLKEDGFHVLNHGDTWTNNMMFKYAPFNKNPIGLKFVDFQICHYNSFIVDLVHCIYSSTVPDIRRKHINEILSAYQEALEYYLKFYSYQGKIPSLDDVKAEHKRALLWSFLCVAMIYPITTGDTTEAFDLEKMLPEEGKEGQDFINPQVLSSEKFINNIGPDFEFYSKNGII